MRGGGVHIRYSGNGRQWFRPHSGLNPWAAALPGRSQIKIKSDSLRIVDTSLLFLCRSELAREKPETAAFCLAPSVIVGDFREQARSYSGLLLLYTTQAGCQAAVLLILGAPSNTLAGIRH